MYLELILIVKKKIFHGRCGGALPFPLSEIFGEGGEE